MRIQSSNISWDMVLKLIYQEVPRTLRGCFDWKYLKTHNSFLKTLSHSKPKTENFCLAPISQNHAPQLSTQFFHFLVEPTACTSQKVGFLSRMSSSLLSPKTLFCLPISADTRTPNVRERFVVFSFPFPSLYFCLHILKTHRLQTALLKYQHFTNVTKTIL